MRKSCIPNIFTFINLGCGVLSLIAAFNKEFLLAALLIILAAIVDRYDGRIARALNVSSDLGKELDSLADLVSFGVSPAILVFLLYNLKDFGPFGIIGYIVLVLYPICGSYRLARYNTAQFDGVFTGVPITICGCALAVYALLTHKVFQNPLVPIILLLIFSYLMVSKLKLKKV
ncbi:MAG: CDP-diacylglycerol--serine O-phosphatidyltransferase [Sarcina sp.]